MLAVYAGLAALIGVISSLRYEQAIPLPEDDLEAASVTILSLALVAFSTMLVAVMIASLGTAIAAMLGVPGLTNYLWLLPFGILLSGAYTVFNYCAIRNKLFSTIATTNVRQAAATIAVQLTAYKFGGVALLLGQVMGQTVGTTTLARPALSRPAFKHVSWRGVLRTAVRYQRFPIYNTWAALVNTAGHQLPPMLLAAFFSAGAAGVYALAHRVLMLPANLIGSAIGNVFLSHAADANRQGKLPQLYVALQDRLIQIGLPPAALLTMAGPDLFDFAFGHDWRIAGEFVQWLALGAFAGFVVSPLSTIFTVLEKQKTGLCLQTLLFCARLTATLTGAWIFDLMVTVALYALASVAGYLGYIVMMSHSIGISLTHFCKSIAVAVFHSALAVLPLIIFGFVKEAIDARYALVAILASAMLITLRYYALLKNR